LAVQTSVATSKAADGYQSKNRPTVPVDTKLDGRILAGVYTDQKVTPPLTLVLNWDAE
jgi:hypothetical protein